MKIITDKLVDPDTGVTPPIGEIRTYVCVTSKHLLSALRGPTPLPPEVIVDWAETQIGRRGQLVFVCSALDTKGQVANFFALLNKIELLLQVEAVRSILLRSRNLIEWSPEYAAWSTENYEAIMGNPFSR